MGNLETGLEKEKLHMFLEKAEQRKPELLHTMQVPAALIAVEKADTDWNARKIADVSALQEMPLHKNDKICVDFGGYMVGHVSFSIRAVNGLPDAPAFLRFKFGEKLCEIAQTREEYHGTLSSSWIQEEYVHIDVIPSVVCLPRRYAFRYLEIMVLDTSPAYEVAIEKITCQTESSADLSAVSKLICSDREMCEIDRVAIQTLHACMQDVFEDGPKRDRRLWIGDLRLQALANYETFRNYDLVKRCLYLFAGLTDEQGMVPACVYTRPALMAARERLFDYALFFVSCLYDYYHATGDIAFLKELYPTALRQIILAQERVGDDHVVRDSDDWWCFIDWHDQLNKQAGAQAVLLYAAKQARELAVVLDEDTAGLEDLIDRLTDGAKTKLWDKQTGFFVSGANRQISWASQIWFVLAGVFDQEENRAMLLRMFEKNPEVGIKTPYMYHHLIDAMFQCGMEQQAFAYIRKYWGGMVADGADCFYEIYDPDQKATSPYGSQVINSYCHAWSCTPTYFIRKFGQ